MAKYEIRPCYKGTRFLHLYQMQEDQEKFIGIYQTEHDARAAIQYINRPVIVVEDEEGNK